MFSVDTARIGSPAGIIKHSRARVDTFLLALGIILFLAGVLRVYTAVTFPSRGEEPNTLLAARMIADHGVPMLPSGVLYLHGATLSYLAAPFVWLGVGEVDNYRLLRVFSVISGVATVFLTYRLASRLTRPSLALAAAAFVALDPMSVNWGGQFRMYAINQMFVVAACLAFLRVIAPQVDEPAIGNRRPLIALVVTYWLAVFAHLGAALLWPAMALSALAVFGIKGLWRRSALVLTLGLSAAAPVANVASTSFWGRGSTTVGASQTDVLPFLSFIGDGHFLPKALERGPDFEVWLNLMQGSQLSLILPIAIVSASLISGLAVVYAVRVRVTQPEIVALGSVLVLYWLPVLFIAVFTVRSQERHFIFLQPLGYIILTAAVGVLIGSGYATGKTALGRAAGVVGIVVLGLVCASALDGIARLAVRQDTVHSHLPVTEYVREHRDPGQLILVNQPVEAYLVFGADPQVRFVPGEADSNRTDHKLLAGPNGTEIDYWTGFPGLRTAEDVCDVLLANPGAWIIKADAMAGAPIDGLRSVSTQELSGDQERQDTSQKKRRKSAKSDSVDKEVIKRPITAALKGASTQVFRDFNVGAYQVKPSPQWDVEASRVCDSSPTT